MSKSIEERTDAENEIKEAVKNEVTNVIVEYNNIKNMKMETPVRERTAFRLRKDLMDKIKKDAKKENRSVNNYVETLLLDAVYREPNEETLAAMREVESGEELETLDMDNFDEFVNSL